MPGQGRTRAVPRGGGTSLAGQCCNVAVVIDWSKHCGQVESVDVPGRRITVQAGAVLDHVNHVLERDGLMVGPKPSSHRACHHRRHDRQRPRAGPPPRRTGRWPTPCCAWRSSPTTAYARGFGPTGADEYARIQAEGGRLAEIYRRLRDLRDDTMELVRTRFPRLERRVSGYNLDQLLPENGFNLARALVGSEGTLVTVLRAELAVVPRPAARSLAVLGFQDIFAAADAVPSVAAHRPLALEAMDETMYRLARAERPHDPRAARPAARGRMAARAVRWRHGRRGAPAGRGHDARPVPQRRQARAVARVPGRPGQGGRAVAAARVGAGRGGVPADRAADVRGLVRRGRPARAAGRLPA
ncbi:hypothetical protein GCM10020220_037230 [Nonomuraea rubra]